MEDLKPGFYWLKPKENNPNLQWVVVEYIDTPTKGHVWLFTGDASEIQDRPDWRDFMDIRGPIEPPKE